MITTKEDIKRATEVMLAYAQGKTIQRQDPDGKWIDCTVPMFDWAGYNYRIKPQLTDIQPNQWISVEDDLPCDHKELMVTEESSCNVFIACKDGYVSSDFIIKGFNKWYWNGDYDPDYWMFPPELPKE